MRKIIFALSILLMSGSSLFAIEPHKLTKAERDPESYRMRPQQFSVTGYSKVPCTIDLVEIRFSVSVRNNDAESSKKRHDKNMVRINKYLKEKEYPDGILSLQSSTLQRQNSSNGRYEDDYYLARAEYLILTDRVQDTNVLQVELTEVGVDEIQSVTLRSSKQRQLEDEARTLALKDAMAKADLTAKTLGVKLGKPVNVHYEAPSKTSADFIDVTVKVTFSFQAETDTQETVTAEPVKVETNTQKTVPADAVQTQQ